MLTPHFTFNAIMAAIGEIAFLASSLQLVFTNGFCEQVHERSGQQSSHTGALNSGPLVVIYFVIASLAALNPVP